VSEARIYIAVPFHGRFNIADPCFSTLRQSSADIDFIAAYCDGCEPSPYVSRKADRVIEEHHVGIERQRRRHFMDFYERTDVREFTHLYLTDSDALHDPNWRDALLSIQSKYGGAPVCGYNTEAHARLQGSTISETEDVIWRRTAPGISFLLTREHVEKVVRWLKEHPQMEHWHWDWTVPRILGERFATTKTSYVDHIGFGGYHHPKGEGYDGGDRATSPTEWLKKKRAEIVSQLQHEDAENPRSSLNRPVAT